MPTPRKTFGEFATSLRERHHDLSQFSLAEDAGVSLSTIQNIESGRQPGKLPTLARIYRDTLRVPERDYNRLVLLWILTKTGTAITLRQLTDALTDQRIQEVSMLDARLDRIRRAVIRYSEDEQETATRFIELLADHHQLFGIIRSLIGLTEQQP